MIVQIIDKFNAITTFLKWCELVEKVLQLGKGGVFKQQTI